MNFGKTCITAAENLEITARKTKTIFGDFAGEIEDWALANERAFGLGSGTIQGYANDIADIAQGLGMAKEESVALAENSTELGVKLSQWANVDTSQAISDIQSALTGSTKAMEKYGVKINDSAKEQAMLNMGLEGTFDSLDNATKAQVYYQAICFN